MTVPDMPNGIYFSMPESEYFALPRFSASGIKDLSVDPMDFWHCSWMNPLKEDESDCTSQMQLGKIIHKRILEGKEAFSKKYAPSFSPEEGTLVTIEDMKEAIKDLGAKPKGKNKADYIAQIIEIDPSVKIHSILKDEYEAQFQGVEFVSQNIINSVEYTAAMIERDPVVKDCFTGGMPEVTILYTLNGVKMKSRIDYLKAGKTMGQVNDLKTFSNPYNKAIDIAIKGTMASQKYHIPAVLYCKAANMAVKMAASTKAENPEQTKFLYELARTPGFDVNFIFRKTTKAPVVSVYRFGPQLSTWAIGEFIIESAIDKFKFYSEAFGDSAWITKNDIQEFCDEDFPSYMLDL